MGKGSPIIISVDATKKVKKRIAPQFISPLPQFSSASMSTPAEVASAAIDNEESVPSR